MNPFSSIASILFNVAPLASSVLKGATSVTGSPWVSTALTLLSKILNCSATPSEIEAKLREIDATKMVELKKLDVALAMQLSAQDFQMEQLDVSLAKDQAEINKIDAQSDSFWKGGWRPTVGWACTCALIYGILAQPLLISFLALLTLLGLSPESVATVNSLMPKFDMAIVMTLIIPLLGLGGLRSWDKYKGLR
jgi:hypothetical protein